VFEPRTAHMLRSLHGKLRLLAAAALAAVAVATAAGASGAASTGFSAHVSNPWFPLLPGTRYLYEGVKDGKPSRDTVTVTHRTKTIQGAPCVAVRDRLYIRGRLEERTTDWYSQDSRGNVWYFGEKTAELDAHGRVTTTEGSWQAGVHGARPGVFMPAHPHVGQAGRQEYYKGHAEDHFEVIGLFRPVTRLDGRTVLLTKEWTPLEPGVVDHKMYARGIGTVLEQTEAGGSERNELVKVTRSRHPPPAA
jgi:hypothetical protein